MLRPVGDSLFDDVSSRGNVVGRLHSVVLIAGSSASELVLSSFLAGVGLSGLVGELSVIGSSHFLLGGST